MVTKKVIKVKLGKLVPNSGNEKVHTAENLKLIKYSLMDLGYLNPIVVDEDFNILAGHGRREALLSLIEEHKTADPDTTMHLFKDEPYECLQVSGLTEVEKTKFRVIDNQSARTGDFDNELLVSSLESVVASDPNFNVGVLNIDGLLESFSGSEIDLGNLAGAKPVKSPPKEEKPFALLC
jgi:hypothetical protein